MAARKTTPPICLLLFAMCALFCQSCGRESPPTDYQRAYAKAILHGKRCNIRNLAVAGKTTIVEFYSKYSAPSVQLSLQLEALAKKRTDIQVVRLDINRPEVQGIDWKSPLAAQYNLKALPYLVVYDGEGQQMLAGDPAYRHVAAMLTDNRQAD